MKAKLLSINISDKKGIKKTPVNKALLIKDYGIENDIHAGKWHRQISLLAIESIDKMRSKGIELNYGDFAENLTTQDVDLSSLPIGTQIRIGDNVLLEVTQIGKKCHSDCEIFKRLGDCVMPREGIFAKVLNGGEIKINDEIGVLIK
jgi:molybdopterin adenylyltransferase